MLSLAPFLSLSLSLSLAPFLFYVLCVSLLFTLTLHLLSWAPLPPPAGRTNGCMAAQSATLLLADGPGGLRAKPVEHGGPDRALDMVPAYGAPPAVRLSTDTFEG